MNNNSEKNGLRPSRRKDRNHQIKESFQWRSCDRLPVSPDTIGEICDIRGKISMIWTIPGYFSLPQRTDTFYESPPFLLSGSTWCIRIYPNGQRSNRTIDSVGLFLRKRDPIAINQDLTVTLGIKKYDGTICISGKFSHNFAYVTLRGFSKCIGRDKLRILQPEIAPHGVLTIFCIASTSGDVEAASQTPSVDSTDVLMNDFRSLFLNKQKSDVIFKVKGHEFRAHKLILQLRSPVLDAMFQHDWKERSNGIVHITDCDPKTFHEFFLFLYTGKIENLTSDNVTGLYSIADKYQVKELKEHCADFMKINLTIDNVCDIIAVADRHQEEELKKSAKELFVRNIKEILPTEKWKLFMTQNSALAVELLMTVIPGSSF